MSSTNINSSSNNNPPVLALIPEQTALNVLDTLSKAVNPEDTYTLPSGMPASGKVLTSDEAPAKAPSLKAPASVKSIAASVKSSAASVKSVPASDLADTASISSNQKTSIKSLANLIGTKLTAVKSAVTKGVSAVLAAISTGVLGIKAALVDLLMAFTKPNTTSGKPELVSDDKLDAVSIAGPTVTTSEVFPSEKL